ncbi:hypothetical protein V8C40DRAFT_230080 [Trichoderma camerunense]
MKAFLGLTLFPGLSLGWRKDSFHAKRERRKKGDESKCRTNTVMHRRCDFLLLFLYRSRIPFHARIKKINERPAFLPPSDALRNRHPWY